MNQLCGDINYLILQLLDVSSLYSFSFVSVGTQVTVQAYRLTHVRPVSSVECVSVDAAERGYVEVLGWLQMTNVNLRLTLQHMNLAANQGHQLMVEWLRQQGCPWDSQSCTYAARNGQLEVLKYLHVNGCPWDSQSCTYAADNGHLEVLKYLHVNDCPWDSSSCTNAAHNGQLKVLKYLHDHGCPWDSWSCASAADNGHLEVLKYLHDSGCAWDSWSCASAARHGHLEVLKYLRVNDCPWDIWLVPMRLAMVTSKCSSIFMTMVVPGTVRSCAGAAENGHLEVLKYLHVNGCPWDSSVLCQCGSQWSSRSAEVSSCQWLSLGQFGLCLCGSQWSPRSAQVSS